MKNLTEILEAILFASGSSRKKSDILALLPEVKKADFDKSIIKLQEKYSGESGIQLLEFNGKIQLSSNTEYGTILAEVLTPLKEKELSRTLLEVLSIIAYKQPITRTELEKIKSTSADYAIGILLKVNLIEVVGRKDAVGRPVLYGTTDEFLKKFQLRHIEELPDYQTVITMLEEMGVFNKSQVELYRSVEFDETKWSGGVPDEDSTERDNKLDMINKNFIDSNIIDEILSEEEELPDFLLGEENIQVTE